MFDQMLTFQLAHPMTTLIGYTWKENERIKTVNQRWGLVYGV